jgi:hypothetical protein
MQKSEIESKNCVGCFFLLHFFNVFSALSAYFNISRTVGNCI